jgi:hypothetical protein
MAIQSMCLRPDIEEFLIIWDSHRHVRFALFFHSLAMIACIRKGVLTDECRDSYLVQIKENQAFIKKWVLPQHYFRFYLVKCHFFQMAVT